MKKILVVIVMVVIAVVFSTGTASAKTSDKQLAKNWAKNHGGDYTITKVITVANGGYKVKVKGTKWTVKYPIKRYQIRLCTKKLSHIVVYVRTGYRSIEQFLEG